MPEGTTFIQEGMPVDKVYVLLLKGCVSAVDYRVRETVYGFCHFNPIETFGAMEILGHMDQYRTTLATTRDSLFLKIPRDSFEKWILKDVDALQMETERLSGICWISPEKSDFMYCFPEMNGFISSLQICMRPMGSSILTVCI